MTFDTKIRQQGEKACIQTSSKVVARAFVAPLDLFSAVGNTRHTMASNEPALYAASYRRAYETSEEGASLKRSVCCCSFHPIVTLCSTDQGWVEGTVGAV